MPSTQSTSTHEAARTRSRQQGPRPVLFAVEDDPSTLELLEEVAADSGWAALGFTQLAEFDRAVAERVPDLVILDDDLPDGRGGDRIRELRRDERTREVPVIVCTAAPPTRRAEIGAWAPVVNKPFDIGEIESYLDGVAQRRGMEAPPAGG